MTREKSKKIFYMFIFSPFIITLIFVILTIALNISLRTAGEYNPSAFDSVEYTFRYAYLIFGYASIISIFLLCIASMPFMFSYGVVKFNLKTLSPREIEFVARYFPILLWDELIDDETKAEK